MVLDGHAQGIFGIDFSPNGYQIATGSSDDTVRIWDMRSLRALHTIPAHKSTISDVKFYRRASQPSDFIKSEDQKDVLMAEEEDVKPSLNGSPAPQPAPIVNLADDKYQSGLYLITAGYDGLVKIWSADDWQLVKALATDAGKVMSADISSDGMFIASGSWNRSFQLFAGDNVVM
jgi:U4/U6 small nuclear ribonucleoprotein PRP4